MERDLFQEMLQADLERWRMRAQLWRACAGRTAPPLREHYVRQLGLLAGICRCAEEMIRDLSRTPRGAWDQVAPGAHYAKRELRASFERVQRRFEESENLRSTLAAQAALTKRRRAARAPRRPYPR